MSFRSVLFNATRSLGLDNDVGLLFSAGTDSLSVLWTLLDMGIQPTCYTFRLEGVDSRDAQKSRIAAGAFGVSLVEVVIPEQPPAVVARQCQKLVTEMKSARKTHVECAWPFTFVAREVAEPVVLCGLNADDLWGTSTSVTIKYGKDPVGFAKHRESVMLDPAASGWCHIRNIFWSWGINIYSPYREESVIRWMLKRDWQQLNRPQQKMPVVTDFQREFAMAPLWRKNDNLQCGSGIREYMARMVDDIQANPYGHRRVNELYRSWL